MSQWDSLKRRRADELDRLGVAHTPCVTCGIPTEKTGTQRCDGCWEVEHRLGDYLRRGGEKAARAIRKALREWEEAG